MRSYTVLGIVKDLVKVEIGDIVIVQEILLKIQLLLIPLQN